MPRTYNKGNNQNTYAFYEELPHLRVAPDAEVVSIYKRLDSQKSLPIEERVYQMRIPVPNTNGVRKSLRIADRATAIQRSCFGVCHLLSSVLAVERNGRRFLLSGVLMQNPEMFGNP